MHHNVEIWHTHLFQSDALIAKAMCRSGSVFDLPCSYCLALLYLRSNCSVNLRTSCCSINAALDWRALGGAPLQCCKSRARGCNSLKLHPGHHRDKENRTGWKNVSEHSGPIRVKGRHTSINIFELQRQDDAAVLLNLVSGQYGLNWCSILILCENFQILIGLSVDIVISVFLKGMV